MGEGGAEGSVDVELCITNFGSATWKRDIFLCLQSSELPGTGVKLPRRHFPPPHRSQTHTHVRTPASLGAAHVDIRVPAKAVGNLKQGRIDKRNHGEDIVVDVLRIAVGWSSGEFRDIVRGEGHGVFFKPAGEESDEGACGD